MKLNKKYIKLSILMLIIGSINIAYLLIFTKFLYNSFTFLNIFYIILGNITYFVILHLINHKIWRSLGYIALAGFYISSLVNYGYYKIFNTFLGLDVMNLKSFKGGLLVWVKDFYNIIPASIYILALLSLSSTIILLSIYFKKIYPNKEYKQLKKSKLSILNPKQRLSYIFVLLIILLFFNFFGFTLDNYYEENPKSTWWEVSAQVKDFGFIGNMYHQAFNVLREDKAYAKEPAEDDSYKNEELLTKINRIYKFGSRDFQEDSIKMPSFDKKPNILVIQLESVGLFAVNNDPSPMPFLKSLMENNITVNNFYPNSCETINAEFSSMCSFWPDSYDPVSYSHTDKDYYCLPSLLKDRYNYQTYFFHSNLPSFWKRDILAPKWGIDNMYMTPYFRQKENDEYVFTHAIEKLAEENSDNPFFAYLLSFTSHSPHNEELIKYNKEKNNLIIEPFEGTINKEYSSIEIEENTLRNYYGFLKATDNALEQSFKKMADVGLLENTIVLIYNDHRYYNFLGNGINDFYNYNKIPFVMVLPDKQKGIVSDFASHIDIAPTVLNLIEQDKYSKPDNFIGQSMFSKEASNQVLNKCLSNVFYINEDVLVQGNVDTNVYTVTNTRDTLINKDKWGSYVKDIVNMSDKAIINNRIGE